jgi:hypothetical protein
MPYVKEFILRAFENDDKPVVAVFYEECKRLINEGNIYDLAVKLDNFKISCTKPNPNMDNILFAFSFICLEENEDQLNVDLEYHTKKLEVMKKEGLMADIAAKEVLSFMVASPFEFRNYEAIQRFMKQTLFTEK